MHLSAKGNNAHRHARTHARRQAHAHTKTPRQKRPAAVGVTRIAPISQHTPAKCCSLLTSSLSSLAAHSATSVWRLGSSAPVGRQYIRALGPCAYSRINVTCRHNTQTDTGSQGHRNIETHKHTRQLREGHTDRVEGVQEKYCRPRQGELSGGLDAGAPILAPLAPNTNLCCNDGGWMTRKVTALRVCPLHPSC